MSIKKLRKYKVIKRKRKLTNHEKSILIRELLKCGNKEYSAYYQVNMLVADLLDLFIEDVESVEAHNYIANISEHTIYLLCDKIKNTNNCIDYCKSYEMSSGKCYSMETLKSNKVTLNYSFKPYDYKDNYDHGGYRTFIKEDIFRRVLDCEILKFPKADIHI